MTDQPTTYATTGNSKQRGLAWQSLYFGFAALAGLVSVIALALYVSKGFDFPGGAWLAIDVLNLVLVPAALAVLFRFGMRIWAGAAAIVAPIVMLITDEILMVVDEVHYSADTLTTNPFANFAYYLPIAGRVLSLSDGNQGLDAHDALLHTLLHATALVTETLMVAGFVIGVLALIRKPKQAGSHPKEV
ncbi:MAG: hypothetical protein ACKOWK_07035 [Micrococcales bacterium]